MYKTEGQADSNFMKREIDGVKRQVCCLRNMSVNYVIDKAGDESWKNTEFMQILIYAQNSERLCFIV